MYVLSSQSFVRCEIYSIITTLHLVYILVSLIIHCEPCRDDSRVMASFIVIDDLTLFNSLCLVLVLTVYMKLFHGVQLWRFICPLKNRL